LILQHAGTDSARLALMRSALIDFRQGQYAGCISSFERLLAMPQTDNFELSARYWLWRSLQKIKADRASEQMAILIDKFPFSYYGIRARAERDNGVFKWVPPVVADTSPSESKSLPKTPGKAAKKSNLIETQVWLTDFERLSWERLQLLLQAGWLEEAQAELKTLPAPQRAEDKALRSRIYAAALNYGPAMKMLGEAWDEVPSLREEPFLSVSFPNEFRSLIDKQAALRGLSPFLVMGVIKQESAFAPRAMSTSPAYGLMQMIAPTAREIAGDLKIPHLQVPDDLYNPLQNIPMGTYYLSKVLKKVDGHVPLALASYNAGPQKVSRWLKGRPSLAGLSKSRSSDPRDELWIDELPWTETSYYVKAILRNQLMYQMLEKGSVELGNPTWAQ
jgi:soluble lytic murein transglycosylase